jgi:hypothetical protein
LEQVQQLSDEARILLDVPDEARDVVLARIQMQLSLGLHIPLEHSADWRIHMGLVYMNCQLEGLTVSFYFDRLHRL